LAEEAVAFVPLHGIPGGVVEGDRGVFWGVSVEVFEREAAGVAPELAMHAPIRGAAETSG